MNQDASRSDEVLRSFSEFVLEGSGIQLYDYQLQPARAILDSIRLGLGLSIVLDFPILSGKDELLAHLEIYLMRMLNDKKQRIIVVNPHDSNNLTAVMRLGDRLRSNIFTNCYWEMEGLDFILGECRTVFYSMEALIVGQPTPTNLLLVANDAQAILPEEYIDLNKLFTSGRKLTRVVCGTEYEDDNILDWETERATNLERKDGIKRLFKVTEAQARQENKPLDKKMANFDEIMQGQTEEKLRSMFLGE